MSGEKRAVEPDWLTESGVRGGDVDELNDHVARQRGLARTRKAKRGEQLELLGLASSTQRPTPADNRARFEEIARQGYERWGRAARKAAKRKRGWR